MNDKKVILILGGNGLVGKAISKRLNANTEFVGYAVGRNVDITSPDSLNHFLTHNSLEPSIIINCAAMTDLSACEENPKKAFNVNTIGAINVAQFCSQHNIPLIHFSTDYVFDGARIPTEGYDVLDRTWPVNTYGASKLAAEQLMFNYYRTPRQPGGVGPAIFRTSHVFGYSGKQSVVDKIIKRLQTEEQIKMNDNIRFSLTYAPDLADAVYAFLTLGFHPSGIYHLANHGGPSLVEIAEYIKHKLQLSCEVIQENLPPKDNIRRPQKTFLDTEWFERTANHTFPSWTDGLDEYLTTKFNNEEVQIEPKLA